MLKLLRYNWQVREEWLNWCESVNEEELLKLRIGDYDSILKTLFHIIEVTQEEEQEPSLGDVLRHMIVHEIHHVSQLSVWSREIGCSPVSPDFIGKSL